MQQESVRSDTILLEPRPIRSTVAMIEKLEVYHGAAVIRLIEDERCNSVRRVESGYLVNDERAIFLKYTTKAHSPWRFTVSGDDLARYDVTAHQFETCVLALVCGGAACAH